MGGSITLRNGHGISCASWAYREMLREIIDILRNDPAARELIAVLNDPTRKPLLLDDLILAELSESDAELVERAIPQAIVQSAANGPVGWKIPDAFPGFLELFRTLGRLQGPSENDPPVEDGV